MADNIHAGHRARMREKSAKGNYGADMPEHELLEMLLFPTEKQKNTNEIAHRLLDKFGSFKGVCDASFEDLLSVKGVGKVKASYIKLFPTAIKLYNNQCEHTSVFKDLDEIGDFLQQQFIGVTQEQFALVSLDATGRLLSYDVLSVGDAASVGLSVRTVMSVLLRTRASLVVLAHNHPSGVALPSPSDLEVTKTVLTALGAIDVKLIDHIILAGNDFVSLSQSDNFKYIFSKK